MTDKQDKKDTAKQDASSLTASGAHKSSSAARPRLSKSTEIWTNRGASSGEFAALRRKGVSFRGAVSK
jgi:hypothetical protein